ncbi:Tctex1 domain-containing protein 4, related [Eimeria praecox]|uniref:Tctex1 domain-containing protein 4, related n=1 Tax=Eimeria praecox TaxID=51316 RepID=U6GTD4_9EIME|nr:Tctex1 domain-containing protein 4, related [Eimeria praecox]
MGRIDAGLQQQLEDSSSVVLPLNRRFPVKAAEEVMASVLQSKLKGEAYSADQASQLAKNLGASLRDALTALSRPRYRIGVAVDLGEDCGQGIRVGSRCFWDSKTDSVARAVYTNSSIFCVATAYAVYQY